MVVLGNIVVGGTWEVGSPQATSKVIEAKEERTREKHLESLDEGGDEMLLTVCEIFSHHILVPLL